MTGRGGGPVGDVQVRWGQRPRTEDIRWFCGEELVLPKTADGRGAFQRWIQLFSFL